jgi:uncharacterized SAM-binding protein YcdF (DUF218 family)
LIFVFKKIATWFLSPLSLCLAVTLCGLWLAKGRRIKLARFLIRTGLALLIIASLPITGFLLVSTLEDMAGDYADINSLCGRGVKTVVVLGGGIIPGRANRIDRMSGASSKRLLEGRRLAAQLPGASLYLLGGAPKGGMPESRTMSQLLDTMGIKTKRLILEESSLDTGGQVDYLARTLKPDQPFALVTSALHMPRALAALRAAGLFPLPAPTDYLVRGSQMGWRDFLPQAHGLALTSLAFKEILGRFWGELRSALITAEPENPT